MTDTNIACLLITQQELHAMLDEAFSRGAEAMSQIRDLPLPKANP